MIENEDELSAWIENKFFEIDVHYEKIDDLNKLFLKKNDLEHIEPDYFELLYNNTVDVFTPVIFDQSPPTKKVSFIQAINQVISQIHSFPISNPIQFTLSLLAHC